MVLRAQQQGPVLIERQSGPRSGLLKLSFRAMGTHCEVHYPDTLAANAFAQEVTDWTLAFERKYSRFLPGSVVSQINAHAGKDWVRVDEETAMLLDLADAVYQMSGGLIDPTILPASRLWDYHSPRPHAAPSEASLSAALRLVGWRKVELRPDAIRLPVVGMAIDLGGFGKEWAVDQALQIARNHGLPCCMVDYGHDIAVMGEPPGSSHWIVGLEDPRQPGTYWGKVALRDCAIASSGNYNRFIEIGGVRYGHIINPTTGWPVLWESGCVTAIAPSCLEAGIFSTSAFIQGMERGIDWIDQAYGAEGCAIAANKRNFTRGFHAHLLP